MGVATLLASILDQLGSNRLTRRLRQSEKRQLQKGYRHASFADRAEIVARFHPRATVPTIFTFTPAASNTSRLTFSGRFSSYVGRNCFLSAAYFPPAARL